MESKRYSVDDYCCKFTVFYYVRKDSLNPRMHIIIKAHKRDDISQNVMKQLAFKILNFKRASIHLDYPYWELSVSAVPSLDEVKNIHTLFKNGIKETEDIENTEWQNTAKKYMLYSTLGYNHNPPVESILLGRNFDNFLGYHYIIKICLNQKLRF